MPSNTTACDGNTIQGNTILPAADGSFTYQGYTLYALPDSISLGEGSSGPACGNTAATECILYIGNNQGDFTKPHLWSQPFFVKPTSDDGGENPGDGTPEVPLAILLPLSAMGLVGGTVLIRRRRGITGGVTDPITKEHITFKDKTTDKEHLELCKSASDALGW